MRRPRRATATRTQAPAGWRDRWPWLSPLVSWRAARVPATPPRRNCRMPGVVRTTAAAIGAPMDERRRAGRRWHTRPMPELPDVTVYVERLAAKTVGQRLERISIRHPFLLRSVTPPISAVEGRTVVGVERLGKRIVLAFEGELFVVVHLMIAGRLRWLERGKTTAPNALAFFSFPTGTLALTEAGKQRRASLHVVEGRAALAALDAGGIDV